MWWEYLVLDNLILVPCRDICLSGIRPTMWRTCSLDGNDFTLSWTCFSTWHIFRYTIARKIVTHVWKSVEIVIKILQSYTCKRNTKKKTSEVMYNSVLWCFQPRRHWDAHARYLAALCMLMNLVYIFALGAVLGHCICYTLQASSAATREQHVLCGLGTIWYNALLSIL